MFIAFIAVLAINIMIKAASTQYGSNSEFGFLQIFLYFYGLYLLLVSVGSLISKKSEGILKRNKNFYNELILLWLIISMSLYQSGLLSLEYQLGANWLEFEVLSFLFPIVASIFGIYGIIRFQKKQEKELNLQEM
jgi:hypothetical protein